MNEIVIELPDDLDNALDNHIALLRHSNVKTSKAELIVKLMRIGLLKESTELMKEERNQ